MRTYSMKDFLEAQVSEATKRNYRFGLKTFAKWYKKPIQEILKEGDSGSGKTLEKYWVWLKKNYRGNSPRNKINTIIQYCKYNDTNPKIRKRLHVNEQLESIRDHPLTVEEARKMYEVGDVASKILIKCWLFGIRNKDARHLEWKDFDFREPSEKLQKVVIRTKKESIPAQLFIDSEFQRLLAKYIEGSIDKKNPFLLQSNKGGKLSGKQLLRKIHSLKDRAGIKVKEDQVFGWHNARYLRLRVGEELDINKTALQKMVGQATGVLGRYTKHSDIRKAALKLSRALRMEPVQETNKAGNLEEMTHLLARALMKLIEQEQGRPFGSMMGMLAKGEVSEKEYLEAFLKEEWGRKKEKDRS